MVYLLARRTTRLTVARLTVARLAVTVVALVLAGALSTPPASAARPIGHPDGTISAKFRQANPTPPKPEHRLWYAAHSWWGILPSSRGTGYTIWQLGTSGAWSDTGVVVDQRSDAGAEAFYNGRHLFVGTHQFTASYATAGRATSSLLRFTFRDGVWALDHGFPVALTNTSMPALSIAQDSTGRIVAAYVSSAHPWYVVTDNDADSDEYPVVFSPPIRITWEGTTPDPDAAATLTGDDIAAVTAGNGFTTVVWSNQAHDPMHNGFYAVRHRDGTTFRTANWSATAVTPGGTNSADNHIALTSVPGDTRGRVFAVLKTSKNDPVRKIRSNPQLLFGVFTPTSPDDMLQGTWKTIRLTSVAQGGTRPAMVIDRSLARARVFYAAPYDARTITAKHNQGVIFEKQVDYETLATTAGRGAVVQRDPTRDLLDDPTTTAQNTDAASGTVVLSYARTTASAPGRFWHSGVPNFADSPRATTTETVTDTATETATETALAYPGLPKSPATSVPTFGSRAKDLASKLGNVVIDSPGRYIALGLVLLLLVQVIVSSRRAAQPPS